MTKCINQVRMYFVDRRMKQGKSTVVSFSKMKRIIYLGFFLIFYSNFLVAQTAGKISGVVIDAQTGEPLIGTNILILGTSLGAATDIDGNYIILNIPPGKYDLHASMVGYERAIQKGVIINSGRTTHADFNLKATAIEQEAIVIEATRPDVQPEKTSTSEIIRSDEVFHMAGMRDVGNVIALAADVTDGHFRGGRSGEELYTLQGMGIVNPLDNSSAFLPIMSAVEEVEVITSGFGAQYGNAQSGVVNISMKEGKPDKWRTQIDTRMRLAGRKHFGPSVYDTSVNQYLTTLKKLSSWLAVEGQDVYYKRMVDNITSMFGRDSMIQAMVARRLWEAQARRDMGKDYGNNIDNSIEIATGGPLDETKRMFIALRSNVTWPVFPTEKPNVEQQLMGNIVTDVGGNASIRLSGGYLNQKSNIFTSANGLGFYSWLWDRDLSILQRNVTNTQLGLRFTQAISSSTFYEMKLNYLRIKTDQGSPVSPSYVADSLLQTYMTEWSKMIATVRSGPDQFTYGSGNDDFRDELLNTVSFEASITSQVTKSHLLNAGLQFNQYFIDVNNNSNVRNPDGWTIDKYSARPYELGLYAQDKMEFEGMIANVGLRLDVWNQNMDYYKDIFSPYRYYTSDSTFIYNKELSPKSSSPILGRLQPRVGISFPVSVSTVFHLNYGAFMQRPSFQYIISSRVSHRKVLDQLATLGNPRLEPQTTNSYDIGVIQGLGEGFTLDVSGYYKDVKNLIQSASFKDREEIAYSTYVNRDYADIRGFRISLNKKRGSITGIINYQYSIATGKSSTPFNASPAYSEDPNTGKKIEDMQNVPIKDILLDFDRTHNVIINLAYMTGEGWGPEIFGVYPFDYITISSNSFIRSGRPYTYNTSGVKEINNKRTPNEYNTNLKVTKRISNFFGAKATMYFEVFNLFNNQILNYSYIFDQSNDYSTGNILRYELYSLESEQGIRYVNQRNAPPFLMDHSFLIYSNSPRSYNIGLIIDL